MAALSILVAAFLLGSVLAAGLSWLLSRKQLALAQKEMHQEASVIRGEVERLSAEWRKLETEGTMPKPPVNGFNLNRRPEAVRRLNGGHAFEKIAAGTGWSVPEIALLQKIEQLHSGIR